MSATLLLSDADFQSAPRLSAERQAANERLERLQQQRELLQRRILRVEEGSEPLDGSSLASLHMRLEGLDQDLERQRRRANGQCCNCGGGCKG
ncbi:hypothetical protein [Metapseudomonas resinovorans]|uniref:Uncharacterized protein n=1 Tax=Metapseudomonas resinovorans NBRC 106553 TaxID=1245471 RepID=S6AMC4_METRE|nr:hypothetical protein [Pseudomonas resinovorans]BAN46628.1 hypothetical protein PCA10_08960 [Pseudomonas resinovorans NBRC 106553]